MQKLYPDLSNDIPCKISDSEVITYLQTKDINWQYINTIKKLSDLNDDVLSSCLNISVKTFRSYRQPKTKFNINVKERILLLLSLINHGIQVFGSQSNFDQWLKSYNFYFDNHNPISFLSTVTGIRFVDDRLTAIEYGDNV